mmetsp:Transcript_22819/g.75701  ORF Transcript_22819/g.75701 Transcript_22819/m.75701 type:complete len:396 (-) Transcript_22819:89-1276(-)
MASSRRRRCTPCSRARASSCCTTSTRCLRRSIRSESATLISHYFYRRPSSRTTCSATLWFGGGRRWSAPKSRSTRPRSSATSTRTRAATRPGRFGGCSTSPCPSTASCDTSRRCRRGASPTLWAGRTGSQGAWYTPAVAACYPTLGRLSPEARARRGSAPSSLRRARALRLSTSGTSCCGRRTCTSTSPRRARRVWCMWGSTAIMRPSTVACTRETLRGRWSTISSRSPTPRWRRRARPRGSAGSWSCTTRGRRTVGRLRWRGCVGCSGPWSGRVASRRCASLSRTRTRCRPASTLPVTTRGASVCHVRRATRWSGLWASSCRVAWWRSCTTRSAWRVPSVKAMGAAVPSGFGCTPAVIGAASRASRVGSAWRAVLLLLCVPCAARQSSGRMLAS